MAKNKKIKAQFTLVKTIPFLIMVLGAILIAFSPSINLKTIGGLIIAVGVAIASWIK